MAIPSGSYRHLTASEHITAYGQPRSEAFMKNSRNWRLAELADKGQYRKNSTHSSHPSSVAIRTCSYRTRNTTGMRPSASFLVPDARIWGRLSLTAKQVHCPSATPSDVWSSGELAGAVQIMLSLTEPQGRCRHEPVSREAERSGSNQPGAAIKAPRRSRLLPRRKQTFGQT
jgi:hypothetical protein